MEPRVRELISSLSVRGNKFSGLGQLAINIQGAHGGYVILSIGETINDAAHGIKYLPHHRLEPEQVNGSYNVLVDYISSGLDEFKGFIHILKDGQPISIAERPSHLEKITQDGAETFEIVSKGEEPFYK